MVISVSIKPVGFPKRAPLRYEAHFKKMKTRLLSAAAHAETDESLRPLSLAFQDFEM